MPSNYHERPEDIDRPDVRSAEQDEHEAPSFERMCRAAGLGSRLRRLHGKNRLLAESVRKAEEQGDER